MEHTLGRNLIRPKETEGAVKLLLEGKTQKTQKIQSSDIWRE